MMSHGMRSPAQEWVAKLATPHQTSVWPTKRGPLDDAPDPDSAQGQDEPLVRRDHREVVLPPTVASDRVLLASPVLEPGHEAVLDGPVGRARRIWGAREVSEELSEQRDEEQDRGPNRGEPPVGRHRSQRSHHRHVRHVDTAPPSIPDGPDEPSEQCQPEQAQADKDGFAERERDDQQQQPNEQRAAFDGVVAEPPASGAAWVPPARANRKSCVNSTKPKPPRMKMVMNVDSFTAMPATISARSAVGCHGRGARRNATNKITVANVKSRNGASSRPTREKYSIEGLIAASPPLRPHRPARGRAARTREERPPQRRSLPPAAGQLLRTLQWPRTRRR